ncbi:NADPH-dependent F420 reductase [Streptomyces heilongjiangensis]|uniref:NADPH-dependent F420 reductase n=1 Tax=Streptomyces heilongjiangensis TaxID=945052 RepID=A0ABW1BGJ1_9ACTN|nr:NAD(P)-binding domain-containing protein [Streptomyces heilongjiangensis]MDC2950466.1 NAD(P)-binding domain-containing protein [Streptomyces heilongjiangensis]
MDIGILGTGRMGVRLASMYAVAGHAVVLGSRDVRRAVGIVRSLEVPNLTGGTYEEAVQAPFVLPAIFLRDGLVEHLLRFQSELEGKIIIDISNPFNGDYSDFFTPWSTSGAELVSSALPTARVVGAFKNVFSDVFDAPDFRNTISDILVASDDGDAKQAVMALGAGTPFRYIDAGPLINSRTIERTTLMTQQIGYDFFPRRSASAA